MQWNKKDGIVVLVAEREVSGPQSGQIFPGSQVSCVLKTEQGVAQRMPEYHHLLCEPLGPGRAPGLPHGPLRRGRTRRGGRRGRTARTRES